MSGQEIYHRTHQFFLSARSLYLLVLEARREDDRSIDDWLKTIRNRAGDDVPVIVVINKSDGPHRHSLQLDETRLRRKWPGIVAFVRTSCDAGDEPAALIQSLRELIARTLDGDERLRHVRDPVPPAWLAVKDKLAELARRCPKLDISRFERLCEDEQIPDPAEQRALLRVLHHLGTVVAHGLDDPSYATTAIKHVTLLDPNWLTTAIYSVMTDCKDATRPTPPGEFTRADLRRVLPAERYDPAGDDFDFVLDMMQHEQIRLCFELPGNVGGTCCRRRCRRTNRTTKPGRRTPCDSGTATRFCRAGCCRRSSSSRTAT